MYHSTANDKDIVKIRLPFVDEGNEVASLWIATRSYSRRCATNPVDDCPFEAENVITTCDSNTLDCDFPIMVYTGPEKRIAMLQLIEDCEYEIALTIRYGASHCEAFPFLIEHTDTISLNESILQNGIGRTYSLSFMSYVGRGFFDVVLDDRRYSIPFEVRSSKIGYRSDYPAMLSDIAEFTTNILLDRKTPLFNYYNVSDDRSKNHYEDFLVLEHMFTNMHLVEMYELVKHNPHLKTVSYDSRVPIELAGRVDFSDLSRDIRGDNLLIMDGDKTDLKYLPRTVREINNRMEYDNPENRLVKELLLSIHHMLYDMIQSLPADSNEYIREKLDMFISETEQMSSDDWLRDVGRLERIPFDSTVLQYRHGYSELFIMFQMLGLGVMFRQYDTKGLLEGHNRKMSKVYEYWCYTRLFKCLSKLSVNKPEPDAKYIRDSENWITTIRNNDGKNGTKFIIQNGGSELSVELFYNKNFVYRDFDKKGYTDADIFCSYSLSLRPDYTLLVTRQNDRHRFIVNFDAKYKMEAIKEPSPVNKYHQVKMSYQVEDLYKMHTYRDALMQSCGSYILYPGSESKRFVKKKQDHEYNLYEGDTIPSIGAIPLIPGSNYNEELESYIREILNRISGLIDGCENIDGPL